MHRTMSYNEMSARYTPLLEEYYVPTVGRLVAGAGGSNKQANRADGAPALTEYMAEKWIAHLRWGYDTVFQIYHTGLRWGVPKELARIILPVGTYSKMRVSANLRNWLAFLTLRDDPAAQWEIRQYAQIVGQLVTEKFPRVWYLFQEGRNLAGK